MPRFFCPRGTFVSLRRLANVLHEGPSDWTTSTIFDFRTIDVSEALALYVILGMEGRSWDEMGL